MGVVSAVLLVLITILRKLKSSHLLWPVQCANNLSQSLRLVSTQSPGAGLIFSSTSVLRYSGERLLLLLFPPCVGALPRLTTNNRRYFPGHIHAFYLEYVYYDRKEQAKAGRFTASHAPGIYSERVQTGGTGGYGTIVQPTH